MSSKRLSNLASMDSPSIATWYDNSTRYSWLWKIIAKRILRLDANKGDLLDIACGPGHLLLTMADLDTEMQLCGVDISPNMLATGEKKLVTEDLRSRIRFIEGSCYDLPLEAESFDLVVSTMALHYIDHAPQFFAELMRVLKDDGVGYIYAFRRDVSFADSRWWKWYRAWDLRSMRKRNQIDEGIEHVFAASYTPDEVESYLRDLPSTISVSSGLGSR